MCNYECHQIGGPWIAENPNCPIHGGRENREDLIQEFQNPATLRLHLGELTTHELFIAQAAVRYAVEATLENL